MNEVCTGRVVISRAGHDKGDAFIVMEILADGQEIRRLKRSSLRSAYALVLQDPWGFGGTI